MDTIHGRQRNNSGSCTIFLKILSYLKEILNQTNWEFIWFVNEWLTNQMICQSKSSDISRAALCSAGGQGWLWFKSKFTSSSWVRGAASWVSLTCLDSVVGYWGRCAMAGETDSSSHTQRCFTNCLAPLWNEKRTFTSFLRNSCFKMSIEYWTLGSFPSCCWFSAFSPFISLI